MHTRQRGPDRATAVPCCSLLEELSAERLLQCHEASCLARVCQPQQDFLATMRHQTDVLGASYVYKPLMDSLSFVVNNRAGFKGGGKLGSCPGPPQKNSKKLLPKET